MESLTEAEAAVNLGTVIRNIVATREQVRITSDEGNIVAMSEEAYNDLLITLEFLSTPGLLDNLKDKEGEQMEFDFTDESLIQHATQ